MKKLALVFVLLAVVASCGSPGEDQTVTTTDGSPAQGGTVVIGLLADVQNWNPYVVEDLDTEHVLALIYPSLAIEQTDYHRHPPSFEPSLAESWSWSEDHLVLTLELNPDAGWADGVPITARDVVFTWQVQTSSEIDWLYGDGKEFIESVEALNDHTVRVVFTHNYPYQLMDLNDGLIIPAHAWAGIPFDRWTEIDWRVHVLGGGPFDLAGHTPQQEITLERNPHYQSPGLPYLDRLVFRIVPSEQGLVTQLLAGDLDFLRSINPSSINRVRADKHLQLLIYDDRSYTHVCWNTEQPLLSDPEIRRALTAAIDRETLIDVVYGGFGRLGVGPILSPFWAFDRDLAPVPFDPDAARAGFEAAGWIDTDGDGVLDKDGDDFAIEVLAPAENELRQDLAILIQEDLKRIGVKAEPRFVEWGTLMAAMQDGGFDALINGWEEPTQIDLSGLWQSSPPDEPTFNFGHYSNPEVDRLLAEVDEITDFAEQKVLFDRIQQLIVADQPYTFLVENTRITGHNSRLQGVDANAATPYFRIDHWYVKTEPARE